MNFAPSTRKFECFALSSNSLNVIHPADCGVTLVSLVAYKNVPPNESYVPIVLIVLNVVIVLKIVLVIVL